MPSRESVMQARHSIVERYQELERTYDSLPLDIRRDAVHSLTEERFYCAAILQCWPSEYDLNLKGVQRGLSGGHVDELVSNAEPSRNELCPACASFFDNVHEADKLLASGGLNSYSRVAKLLDIAAKKANWVEEMLNRIVEASKDGEARDFWSNEQTIGKAWNNLCLEVTEGRSVPVAVARVHSGTASYNPDSIVDFDVRAKGNMRRWFDFKPSPFAGESVVAVPTPCLAWPFTEYSGEGTFDPKHERVHLYRRNELPKISREDWTAWYTSIHAMMESVPLSSIIAATRIGLAFPRAVELKAITVVRQSAIHAVAEMSAPKLAIEPKVEWVLHQATVETESESGYLSDAYETADEGVPTPKASEDAMKTSLRSSPTRETLPTSGDHQGPTRPVSASESSSAASKTSSDSASFADDELTDSSPETSSNTRPTWPGVADSKATSFGERRLRRDAMFRKIQKVRDARAGAEEEEEAADVRFDGSTSGMGGMGRLKRPYSQSFSSSERLSNFSGYSDDVKMQEAQAEVPFLPARQPRPYLHSVSSRESLRPDTCEEAIPDFGVRERRPYLHTNSSKEDLRPQKQSKTSADTPPMRPSFTYASKMPPPQPPRTWAYPKAAPPKQPPPSPPRPEFARPAPPPPTRPAQASAPPAYREPPPEAQGELRRYIIECEALSTEDSSFPIPCGSLTAEGLADAAQTAHRTKFVKIAPDQLAQLEVQSFFARGMGVAHMLCSDERYNAAMPTGAAEKLMVVLTETSERKLAALLKYLRLRERPRWHCDRLNMRTGVPGVVNEENGKHEVAVVVRTAVQDLLDQCVAMIEKLK
ncbi:hypothetical protein LTR56_005368 [Elasticomyces elasticus]|nr:hypothetical protein LTR22_018671 [Elasticomyces elasticus]KAK3651862.1 hypothetical protein LTR56_005368 [Elasticomyces elasticus]KAK4927757.1 hypothetical protein LTR49_005380 [Elasticomyces elasticus]KAK5761428.1 hypothetical protein LTS12_008388 [Elasticomyces elasticus]